MWLQPEDRRWLIVLAILLAVTAIAYLFGL